MGSLDLIRKYDEYRESTLNLQASENVLSPNAKKALSSDMASRYSLFVNGYNAYGGTKYFDELIEFNEKNIKKLFNAMFCESRPLSGHISAEISLLSLLQDNRKIMAISDENGGYPGYFHNNLEKMFDFNSYEIPYNNFSIDYELLSRKVKETKPSIIVLGQSLFIRGYNMKIIREIADKNNTKIIYDGSHVLGLIAGSAFQTDALKYSDILLGSTHKTFFGPQGGIILTNNEEIYEKIEENIVFKTMDNFNLSRYGALSVSVEEMLSYGKEYAENVVKNSKNLAKELLNSGFGLYYGSEKTETHQILLDLNFLKEKNYDFLSFSKLMEDNKIIIDRFGRVGVQEITRYGLNDMKKIAEIFNGIYNKLNISDEINDIIAKKKLKYW